MRCILSLLMIVSCLEASVLFKDGFETYSTGSAPGGGWQVIDNNGDGYSWTVRADRPHTGSNSLRGAYSTSGSDDDWAITPGIIMAGGHEDTLIFWFRARSSSYPEKLRVYLMASQNIADTLQKLYDNNNITDTTYQRVVITATPGSDDTFYIGFDCYSDANEWYLYLDDIEVDGTAPHDLGIVSVNPQLSGWVADSPQTLNISCVTKNVGTNSENNFYVYFQVDSSGSTVYSTSSHHGAPLAVGDSVIDNFTWTHSINHRVKYILKFYHDLTDDNVNNDSIIEHIKIKGHQGADTYGWIFKDSEAIGGGPAYNWLEISTTGTNLSLLDDDSKTVKLADSVTIYNVDYDSMTVSSNGGFTFTGEQVPSTVDTIPTGNLNVAFLPFWEDLDPSSGGAVYYQTFGDTLSVIEWYQVPLYGTSHNFTFEAQVQSKNPANYGDTCNDIIFLYKNMDYISDSMQATIGMQDSSAVNGSGKYIFYTYNEDPYTPNYQGGKGGYVIKFYNPEALSVAEQGRNAGNEIGVPMIFSLKQDYFAVTGNTRNLRNAALFDLQGREIGDNLLCRKGTKAVVQVSGLKSMLHPGIYFLRVRDDKFTRFMKMIFVK